MELFFVTQGSRLMFSLQRKSCASCYVRTTQNTMHKDFTKHYAQ
ncbi:hypothetical protein HMPREF9069_00564 [Atopobium sp. oral taxon 810 str. F0209]|nr:hypothetical protein HMPREF9069_00564 [Atopobium sp. oral taxon 810 str. F0209]